MRAVLLVVLSLALASCKCSDTTTAAADAAISHPAPSTTVPHIKLSEQRRLLGDAGVGPRRPALDGIAMGRKLAPGVAKQCTNDGCRHEKCGPLCGRWLGEAQPPSDKPVLGRQKVYLDCVSYCMFPYPDGGAP